MITMHHDYLPHGSGPLVLIHGGAGNIGNAAAVGTTRQALYVGLQQSLIAASQVLQDGGDALAAALAAIANLEDDPQFNAGYGAVCCADGGVELSASVMEGRSRRCGAVAGVRRCPRPAALAASLLDHPHVLLFGAAAEALAEPSCLPLIDPAQLLTPRRQQQLRELQQRQGSLSLDHDGTATVGVVVRDAQGWLLAITSTGGLSGQLSGRIGDSPIPGHGTWADNHSCAVSTTGMGEAFMRCATARAIHDRMTLLGEDAPTAAAKALDEVTQAQGEGGCLVLSAKGPSCLSFSSPHMLRGVWSPDNGARVAVGREALTEA
ncbi:MAG: hypothetical protein EA401_00395 [Planctomycetota bacterium]|nr:MAG: hypothetical protein EA401_00395 [Planctomycetota bacterium]